MASFADKRTIAERLTDQRSAELVRKAVQEIPGKLN